MNRRIKTICTVVAALSPIILWGLSYSLNFRAPPRLEVTEEFAVDLMSPLSTGLFENLPLTVEWDRGVGFSPEPVPLKNLHVVHVALRNTGGAPFKWEGMVTQPLKLSVTGGGEILAATPAPNAGGPRSRLVYSRGGPDVEVSADYINPGESFSLYVFHTSDRGSALALCGRVFDHPPLEMKRPSAKKGTEPKWYGPARMVAIGTFFGLMTNLLFESGLRWLQKSRARPKNGKSPEAPSTGLGSSSGSEPNTTSTPNA